MDDETKKMLLFALFTLVVWSVVVVYMVKEKNPDACAPYWDVARSNRGLVALLVSGVVGYFLFMHETPVERPRLFNTSTPSFIANAAGMGIPPLP